MGGAAGLGTGGLQAQGPRALDWLERAPAAPTAQAGGPEPALSAVEPQRGRTQFGFPGAGGGLQGVSGPLAAALRLGAAFGREFHRSGSLCGYVLQGQRLGARRHGGGLQPAPAGLLSAQPATQAALAQSTVPPGPAAARGAGVGPAGCARGSGDP